MSDLFLASQKVEPRRLAELGYVFRKGELAQALAPPRRARVEPGALAAA